MSVAALLILPLALGLGATQGSTSAVTSDEINELISQLAQCWSPPILAKGTVDAAIDIDLTLNRDGTVAQAGVVDQVRYATDPVFRALADSELKAIHDPKCSPLALPLDKYDLWKSMTIHFDPKEVSGR
jgi:hypothetical protein